MSDVFDFELHENNGEGEYDSDRSDDVRKSFYVPLNYCALSPSLSILLDENECVRDIITIFLETLNLLCYERCRTREKNELKFTIHDSFGKFIERFASKSQMNILEIKIVPKIESEIMLLKTSKYKIFIKNSSLKLILHYPGMKKLCGYFLFSILIM